MFGGFGGPQPGMPGAPGAPGAHPQHPGAPGGPGMGMSAQVNMSGGFAPAPGAHVQVTETRTTHTENVARSSGPSG